VGEGVSVTTILRSAAAGAASGAPGARRLHFSFSIARPAVVAGRAETAAPHAAGHSAARPPNLTHSFVTEPGFRMPWIRMSRADTDPKSGDILLDAQDSGQNAVYILNGRGRLLRYQPTGSSNPQAYGLREQSYRGKPVLTYWQGAIDRGGRGQGQDLILEQLLPRHPHDHARERPPVAGSRSTRVHADSARHCVYLRLEAGRSQRHIGRWFRTGHCDR
jgi:hypothetical protein